MHLVDEKLSTTKRQMTFFKTQYRNLKTEKLPHVLDKTKDFEIENYLNSKCTCPVTKMINIGCFTLPLKKLLSYFKCC